MKAVILAGGLGTRISEETDSKPKPMVSIGGYPILWHIMKIYRASGVNDFIICCGYKGYVIKEYFANYALHMSDVSIDLKKNNIQVLQNYAEPWNVTLVDTGLETMTGGRLKRIREYLDDDEDFCFTYGDGVSDVDIGKVIEFHGTQNTLATVVASRPLGRFGAIDMEENLVTSFRGKPVGDDNFINAGFFVLSTPVFDYISGDDTVWEREPLERLAGERQLSAFIHDGFWQCMDTLRDKIHLESLWNSGDAPWKRW